MQMKWLQILGLSGLLAAAACGSSNETKPEGEGGGGGGESATSSSAGGAGGSAATAGGQSSSSSSSSSGQGGAGSTSSASGSGGSPAFQPCPTNGDPCKILPFGDSITWGFQYDGAYRVKLFSNAVAAGQKITFTGSLSNGPDTVANAKFPKNNEGHSAWTIQQITGLVPQPAFGTTPHIVLLMIGTNDVYAPSGQGTMPDRLGALIDKIVDVAPDALLVVAKITPLANAGWSKTLKTYNDAIPGVVESRVAAGKHIIVVDMNTDFKSSMLSADAIHPNKSGYDFMGDVWYAAIKDFLPK